MLGLGYAYLWLARNEGRNPLSSPNLTHYGSFLFLFHSFIPSQPKVSLGVSRPEGLGFRARAAGSGFAVWNLGVGVHGIWVFGTGLSLKELGVYILDRRSSGMQ